MTNEVQREDGAVCYAGGLLFGAPNEDGIYPVIGGTGCASIDYFNVDGFQLNHIRTGDYIPTSELDTEQKYNDVVEVFMLFGFKSFFEYEEEKDWDYFVADDDPEDGCAFADQGCTLLKRQLTYTQIIAIGKLKRMMDEHETNADDGLARTAQDIKDGRITDASSNKYERVIYDRYGDSAHVDVYDVLQAFEVTCPATQHAIKKLLCSGLRGHKDAATDLLEAKESINRAIELHENK